jgi:hypothetical protein
MARQPAHLLRDVGRHRRDRVIVVRRDAHDPRCFGGAEPDRVQRPQRDRNLPEDLAGHSLADDAVNAVDDLDRLDAAAEHAEERAFVALVRGVFAGNEADVRRGARKPVSIGLFQAREDLDPADVVGRHHADTPIGRGISCMRDARTTKRLLRANPRASWALSLERSRSPSSSRRRTSVRSSAPNAGPLATVSA